MLKFFLLSLLVLPSNSFARWQKNFKCKEKIRLRNMSDGPVLITFYAAKDLPASKKQIRLVKNQKVDELIYWNEKYCSSYGFGEVWFNPTGLAGEKKEEV